MPPRFADLESRVTGAVFTRLSNAVATFDDGRQVPGIFDNPSTQGDVGQLGMLMTRPTFSLPSDSVPPSWWSRFEAEPFDVVDGLITVNDTVYTVVLHEPDGAGMSRLVLEVQA